MPVRPRLKGATSSRNKGAQSSRNEGAASSGSTPFAGTDPPAALFHYSRDRRGEHPQAHLACWSGIFQADAYGGYGELYRDGRGAGPVLEAGCFAQARRKFFELADVEGSARKRSRGERTGMIYPIALEAVKRLDALFDIERAVTAGLPPSGSWSVRSSARR